MSWLSVLDDTSEKQLLFALQKAIGIAIQKGTNEPGIVAQLTYQIPTQINKLGIGKSAGININVGGVFVHQTPKVTFSGISKQKSIELGDLLLVSTVIDGSKTTRKAMLYQAKMFKTLPVKPDNPNQHYLYQSWPVFKYFNSGPVLTGETRDVAGLDLHSAAKYLLLSKSNTYPINTFFFQLANTTNGYGMTAHATEPLSVHECFIRESYRFVLGDAGKEFQILNAADPDIGWSRMINDLINVTAKKVTSHMKSAGSASGARGCMLFATGFSFLKGDVTDVVGENEPPYDIPPFIQKIDDGDGDGISMIEFVVEREQ